ncbi:MAG: 4Fe-4S binding protein [Dehalococcoidia bacterium]|nr:4Fe-4S binding protein [Dehalococcoidia bacterium]
MDKLIYEQLVDAVARRGGGFPAIKCRELYEMLDLMFTEEDARIAVAFPDKPVTADEMAVILKIDTEAARRHLEGMAQKGLLFAGEYSGVRIYTMFPLIPGSIENQLLTGATDDRAKKMARLCMDYIEFIKQAGISDPSILPRVAFARVLTVDKDIPSDVSVQPYDRILQYVDKAEYITQVVCHCRHMYELLGDKCDKPKDVCLSVGPGAHFMAEYGLGRAISREEARKILQRSEDAGLVHIASNTGKYLDFICNCCSCHCDNIRSMKKAGDVRILAEISGFISQVDAGECIGCGDCIARCPMDALSMKEEIACLEVKRCIGCGLCVSVCPSGAISLKNRENAPVPYADSHKLNQAIVESINKPD